MVMSPIARVDGNDAAISNRRFGFDLVSRWPIEDRNDPDH